MNKNKNISKVRQMARFFTILPMMMLVLTLNVYAQSTQKVTYANKKQIDELFATKLMVVLDANPFTEYNMVIKDFMSKYWTLTPYEIITHAQFDKTRNDPKITFMFLSKVQLERDKKEVHYMYLNIAKGVKSRNLTAMPELLSIPLSYTGADEESYAEKLPLMLLFAQIHLNNIKAARNPKPFFNLKSYSDDSRFLKDMTLLVVEADLAEEVNTVEKIQKDYPGDVRIVTLEEIAKAIEEKRPNTAVLHQVSPGENDNRGRSYCQVYGVVDGKLYYYNHQAVTQRRPPGMLARDFRLITGKWF